jgi:hypothetical protein
MVEDLGSRWGTKLNGQPLTDAKPLKHGDEIRLGKSTINYICYWDILPQADTSQGRQSGADDLQAQPVDIPAASVRSQSSPTPEAKAPTPPPPPKEPAPPKKEPEAKAKPAEPPKPPTPEAAPEKPATPDKPKPLPPKPPERGSALPWAIALVLLLLAGIAYLAYLVFHKH